MDANMVFVLSPVGVPATAEIVLDEYKRVGAGRIRFCCSAAKTAMHVMALSIKGIFNDALRSAAFNWCMAR